MSWSQLELLMKTYDLWKSPAQFAVMVVLCFRDHDRRGFAAPSKREIARLLGCSPRRVNQLYEELEAMQAMARLGPDREFGGRNRYVVTIEKAIERKRHVEGEGGEAGFIPLPIEGMKPASWGDEAGFMGGDEAGFMGGVKPASPPWPTDLKEGAKKEEATAGAVAARARGQTALPFMGATPPPHPEHQSLAAARALRLKKLRTRVAGLARSILLNPAMGRALLNGEIATSIDALVEATKRLCARKRVAGYGEVVHAMCTSELFKHRNPHVIAGKAPRPRDLRRQRRTR